jgi:hypothetical protein
MDLIIQIGCFTISWHFVIVFRFFYFPFSPLSSFFFYFSPVNLFTEFLASIVFHPQYSFVHTHFFFPFKHTREIQMYIKTKRFSFSLKMYPTFFFFVLFNSITRWNVHETPFGTGKFLWNTFVWMYIVLYM